MIAPCQALYECMSHLEVNSVVSECCSAGVTESLRLAVQQELTVMDGQHHLLMVLPHVLMQHLDKNSPFKHLH